MTPKPVTMDPWSARVMASRGCREDGRWYWRARSYQGGREHVRARWATREEVRGWLKDLGEPGGGGSREIITVADLLEVWHGHITAAGGRSPNTLKSYEIRAINVKRGPCGIGHEPVEALLRGLAEDYVADRTRGGLSPYTVRAELQVITTAWNWARRRGRVLDRPILAPRLVVEAVRDKYTPSPGEVVAVINWLEGSRGPWRADAVRLLWATGARVGELAALTWDQVNLAERVMVVAGKTGRREVPLAVEAIEALHRLQATAEAGQATVLPGISWRSRKEQVWIGIGWAIEAIQKRARQRGQPEPAYWSPHGLRRAAADRLCRAGARVEVVAEMLGHSLKVMMAHYRRVSREDKRTALELADLGSLPRGRVLHLRNGDRNSDRNSDPDKGA